MEKKKKKKEKRSTFSSERMVLMFVSVAMHVKISSFNLLMKTGSVVFTKKSRRNGENIALVSNVQRLFSC